MSAFELLDKLREKPEPVKQLIAFWVALVITLLIGGVWLTSLAVGSDSQSAAASKSEFSPFALIKNSWDDMQGKK